MSLFKKNILGNSKIISDVVIQDSLLTNYSVSDARAALFLNTTNSSLITNGVLQYSTGYYINEGLMPYVSSGVIKNISDRIIVGYIFAKCIAFSDVGDKTIDLECLVDNASYSFGKVRFFQKTQSAQTSGSLISGAMALLPGQELTLKLNMGRCDGFAETQLQLIEFKNSPGGLADIVIV